MKTPEQMLEELGKPFPANAVEKRKGAGGRMYDYVAAETVIRRLNSATNGEWSFVVKGHEWRGDVLITWGELTIPGLGTRSGFGVQAVPPNAGEDLIKGSASDCLKKCATQFGVALELYGPDLEAGEIATQQRPQPQRAPQAPQRPRGAPQPVNTTTDAPPVSLDREKEMRRLHAAANDLGFTHDELRIIANHEERTRTQGARGIASMSDADATLLVIVRNVIENQTVSVRRWLDQQPAQQAELNPSEADLPTPRRDPASYAQ